MPREYSIKEWLELLARVEAAVPAGCARNITELAKELKVPRKTIITLEPDLDSFCMNVGLQIGFSSVVDLPKRQWTLENLKAI